MGSRAMPLYPPAPIVRVTNMPLTTSNFGAASVRDSRSRAAFRLLFAEVKACVATFICSVVAVVTWGVGLHIAVAAVSSPAELQSTLMQYAMVLQWLTAA